MADPESVSVKWAFSGGFFMKVQPQQSDSLKKALEKSRPFDEAEYYKSKKVEMGGDEDEVDTEDEDDDDDYEEELPEEI